MAKGGPRANRATPQTLGDIARRVPACQFRLTLPGGVCELLISEPVSPRAEDTMVFNRFGSTDVAAAGRPFHPLLAVCLCCGPILFGLFSPIAAQQPEPPTAAEDSAAQPAAASTDDSPPKPPADSKPQPPVVPNQPDPPPAEPPTTDMAGPTPPPAAVPAQQQPPPPAADGTVSVVIAPPGNVPSAAPPTAAPAIQPASATPAAAPEEKATPTTTAAETLLEQVLQPLERQGTGNAAADQRLDSLYSRPLPLLEALQRSGDRSRRLWITQAYWKVAADYGSVRFASASLEQLQLVAPGRDPHDRGLLDVVIAAAEADRAEALASLIASQQQLVDLIRLPVSEPLPWPVDRPLVGPYETHFAAIFATRPATGRIRAINAMLPSKHEALEARATATLAAADALARAEADHARGNRPIEAVLVTHQVLRQQRERFLEALAAYNLDIAEYAMAVADVTVPDGQYVSMLIGNPVPWTPQPPATVVPATNLQPLEPQIAPTP